MVSTYYFYQKKKYELSYFEEVFAELLQVQYNGSWLLKQQENRLISMGYDYDGKIQSAHWYTKCLIKQSHYT